jgi:ribosomal protein L20A (L18A)
MSFSDKHIIESYSGLFEGLSSSSKIELIETLTKSLKKKKSSKESKFYKTFGAFPSKKSAEEIIADIKSSKKFRRKQIKF